MAHIQIHFDLKKQDAILFQIKNKIMLNNLNGNGTGIETTKKRLELIYPNKHQLSISEISGEFIVALALSTG